jgi:hypothetical protein
MVKLHFETLAPGMKAKLDSPHRTRHGSRPIIAAGRVTRKKRRGSVNCIMADAVKMPFNRTQA